MLCFGDYSTKCGHQFDTGSDTKTDTKAFFLKQVMWNKVRKKMETIKAEYMHSASIEKYDYINFIETAIFCQEKSIFMIYFLNKFHYNIGIMKKYAC